MFGAVEYLWATNLRYQPRIVSGLATQASSASALRPNRFPISARVIRSGWKGAVASAARKMTAKNSRSNQATKIHGHRNRIPARFTERSGRNLDDPEQQSDFGNLAESIRLVVVNFVRQQKYAPSSTGRASRNEQT
jgi:hypothetical protein